MNFPWEGETNLVNLLSESEKENFKGFARKLINKTANL